MSIATQVDRQDQRPVADGRDVGIPSGVDDLPDRVKELLPDGVLDELLAGARSEEEIVGPGGLLSQFDEAFG
jgi:hypothetical protein